MKSFRFVVYGRVQGVWYRKSVQLHAEAAGFNGYVKNLQDGSVESCVTIAESRKEEFLALLKEGSPLSEVTKIETFSCNEIFENGFTIR